MGLGSGSADILFKIKADGSNAEAELRKVERELKNMGAAGGGAAAIQKGFKGAASEASNLVAVFTGNKLTGITSQITSLAGAFGAIPGPAGLAIGAVAGFGAVVATVAAGLFELTKQASEYGSAMHDAADKTGFTAEMQTALKVAADNSSSSLESVTSGVAKFAKLIGQAADGNEKAQKTLKGLGVTSYDLDTALSQVTKTIYNAKDGTEQITTAQKAFGKAGAELIPVIKQAGGDITAYTKDLERLGATLTEKDIVASDAFGDSLGLLKAQAAAAAVAFTSELMPVLTSYFTQASEWYGRNKEEVRLWGAVIAEVVADLARGIAVSFDFIQRHAESLREYLAYLTFGISELALAAANLIRLQAQAHLASQSQEGIGRAAAGPERTLVGGGGGGGKGGGGGAPKEDKTFDEAIKRQKQIEGDYKASYDRMVAENELRLEKMKVDERAYAVEVARIAIERLETEKMLNEQLLTLDSAKTAKAERREEIEHKIDTLRTQISIQQLKNEKELHQEDMKDLKEGYEVYKKTLQAKLDRDAEYRKALEERRRKANYAAKTELTDTEKEAIKTKNAQNLSILGDSILSVRNEAGNLTGLLSPMLPIFQMMGGMVKSLADGFGSLVQNMILTGSAGPHAMRKLVASVLAGVAAQAAVLAIMETAYGIAALTPWGFAIYGSPAHHFLSAAKFALVAGVAGLAGRAVAGNSFNQATGTGASSGGAGSNSSANDPSSFTVPFRGFGNTNGNRIFEQLNDTMQKLALVTSVAEETHNRLARRIEGISPSDVVRLGAYDAKDEIHEAVQEKFAGDQRASAQMFRNLGLG